MKTPKCEFCNRNLVISKIDMDMKQACLSCPDFMAGNDEHTHYFVELTDELLEKLGDKRAVLYW